MTKILLINGPNLNLLGTREPERYGSTTLETLTQELQALVKEQNAQLECFQANAEHQLIEKIHAAKAAGFAFIVINPGGLTHTSISLRDALLGMAIPFIEVHISNIYARESFRHHSYLSDVAVGTISGLGTYGYHLAMLAALRHLRQNPE